MKERIILLILVVIIGFFSAQLSINRVEKKVKQPLLNQYSFINHENSLGAIMPAPPPPIPKSVQIHSTPNTLVGASSVNGAATYYAGKSGMPGAKGSGGAAAGSGLCTGVDSSAGINGIVGNTHIFDQ